MLFVPFSDTSYNYFMFPYGQFVLKHELDRLADVIKKILMIRKLHPQSTMAASTSNTHNAIDSKQQKDVRY